MRLSDILAMAIHNLRFRPARTALNLVGIVVGCIVLLMTAAGVTGVKETLHVLFDSSETARQIGILSGNNPVGTPPEEATRVAGAMDPERRERIKERLQRLWMDQNRRTEPWTIDLETIRKLEAMPHVQSVVPDIYLPCIIRIPNNPKSNDDIPDEIRTNLTAGHSSSGLLAARVLAGEPFSPPGPKIVESLNEQSNDSSESFASNFNNENIKILIDEFLAYRLGFRSDDDLEQLVGRPIEVEYQITASRSAQVFAALAQQFGDAATEDMGQQKLFTSAVNRLVGELDKTSLNNSEKLLLKNLMRFDSSSSAGPQIIKRQFTICGVVRNGQAESLAQLFRGHWFGGGSGLVADWKIAAALSIEQLRRDSFYNAVVTIDSTKHLTESTEALEALGARTLSAERIIRSMDESVDRSGWIVYGIAAAILLTAGIGISNTLLISVLERTPEFGILKSVGAQQRTLLGLMVCEGAILGAVGAAIAVALSLLVAWAGRGILESYLEYRLGGEIASVAFRFSGGSIVLVTLISIGICVLASIIPAWRAARLDPIVAMRRT